jgi:hypothetical protein
MRRDRCDAAIITGGCIRTDMIGTPEERRTSRELHKKGATKARHTDCY